MYKLSDYLTPNEVAGLLGISKWAVYKRVQRQKVPVTRVGRGVLILKRDTERMKNK